MPRDCYPTKVGAFAAAAINLMVGGLTLGGAIYKVAVTKSGNVGVVIVMFLLSILLIHSGLLLIIGIVLVDTALVFLYLVLNSINWIVATVMILKETASTAALAKQIVFTLVLIVAWCFEFVVYKFCKQMSRHGVVYRADVETARGGYCRNFK
ncbi:hypothetical protein MTP99_011833 [Tenebrio molitor]|nr:hypothetical protein MTP99_011833 [Tenebrio molitor]